MTKFPVDPVPINFHVEEFEPTAGHTDQLCILPQEFGWFIVVSSKKNPSLDPIVLLIAKFENFPESSSEDISTDVVKLPADLFEVKKI